MRWGKPILCSPRARCTPRLTPITPAAKRPSATL
jgi:hypothetical protein